jgi:hypothetical protein
MEALARLETTIYGDASRDKKGLVERVNTTEVYVMEIRNDIRRITWLILVGVIGAGLNLIINAKNLSINTGNSFQQGHNQGQTDK